MEKNYKGFFFFLGVLLFSFPFFQNFCSEIKKLKSSEENSCISPPPDMISWWGADNNALDIVGENHGVLRNGATYNAGIVEEAFSFDGVDDYADLGNWFNFQTFTIDMWINPNSSQVPYADIIDNNHNDFRSWVIQQNSNITNQYIYYPHDGSSITFNLPANQWTHLAITRDETTRVSTLYLNGTVAGICIGTQNIPYDGSQYLRLARWGGGGRYWNGLIDELEIYNRVLNQDEIQAIYNAGSSGKCKPSAPPPSNPDICALTPLDLVSWWSADNNTLDIKRLHNLTLKNGATYGTGYIGQAFSFDGQSYAEIGNWFNFQTFTIDMWVNPALTQSNYANIIDNNHNESRSWVIQQNGSANNEYYWAIADGSRLIFFYLPPNKWTHLAITRDGNTKLNSLYLNGVLIRSFSGTSDVVYDGTQFLRLATWGGGDRHWKGMIDELEIFTRALSPEEIQAIYNAGRSGKCRPCSFPPSDIVSWWRAENNGDDSIGTNNGTLMNGATFSQGIVGQSFSFDGIDDVVFVEDSPSLDVTTQFTLDAWVYPKNYEGGYLDMGVITKHAQGPGNYNGYLIALHRNGETWQVLTQFNGEGEPWPTNQLFGGIVKDNEWHHIASTYDNYYLKIYVDGLLVNSIAVGSKIVANSSSPLRIGNDWGLAPFNGYIDEPEVLNRALSEDEILSIYNSRNGGKCPFFKLNIQNSGNGSGTILSVPSGIDCGTTCSYDFPVYKNVTLTAEPALNSFFSGWQGECSTCGNNPQCTLYMNSEKNCYASFSLRPPSEASDNKNPMTVMKGPNNSLLIYYTPSNCATDHTIYWGIGPIINSLNWTNAECGFSNLNPIYFDPGEIQPGSFLYFVIVGNNGYEEGSYGKNHLGIERPEAIGNQSCNWPQNLENNCE